MRILVLTKRQYMSKDLLDDRYGRFREIPLALARRGHQVRGICLSYQSRADSTVVDRDDKTNSKVVWDSVNLGRFYLPGLIRFVMHARRILREFEPDVIWTGSDSFYGPLGLLVTSGSNVKVIFDIYDHFETFGSTRIPGVLPLYRWSARRAEGLTSFSEAMSRLVKQDYRRKRPLVTLVNGTCTDLFYPRDKAVCRAELGLPPDAKIIGTAGALSSSRGIATLFDAFEGLAQGDDKVHLVIAGPRDHGINIPAGSRVHDFGMLPYEQVPILINALDVGIICHRHSSAANYGFPYKAYEMMACRIPIVAADIGAITELLQDCPQCLYTPEDTDELVRAIRYQFAHGFVSDRPVPNWDDIGKTFNAYIEELVSEHK